VLSETDEFVLSRALLTLFQRDRIFGRDNWMGHAGNDMSDLYDKIKEDVAFRRKWAERCGFGFDLASVVPNVPKTEEKAEAEKAA